MANINEVELMEIRRQSISEMNQMLPKLMKMVEEGDGRNGIATYEDRNTNERTKISRENYETVGR